MHTFDSDTSNALDGEPPLGVEIGVGRPQADIRFAESCRCRATCDR